MDLTFEKAKSAISRTDEGILMLAGAPKQHNIFSSRTNRNSKLLREMPESSNAERSIVVTDSGILSACRREQPRNSRPGIFVRCDGFSNVTEDNPEQPQKAQVPRVETEAGITKLVKMTQLANAKDLIC
jgi:hypothetical protein